MNKKTITIIIIAVIILLAIIGYLWYKNRQAKKRQELLATTNETGTTPSATSSSGYSDSFPLKVGSKGNNVLALQVYLNKGCGMISTPIAEDGDYGPQTELAADVCLATLNGHKKGEVSYTEFKYLKKQASASTLSEAGGGAAGPLEALFSGLN